MAFNVLVVDDSAPMRSVIKKTIKISGFDLGQVFEAANGVEALEVLKDNWVDVVVTDYNMPEMDGLQLIENMKQDELMSTIPIIVVTTEGSKQKVKMFMDKGAVDYVQKPFTPEQIKEKLTRILGEPEDGDGETEDSDEDLDF